MHIMWVSHFCIKLVSIPTLQFNSDELFAMVSSYMLFNLGSAGLENLVVKTEDEYIDKAIELASNVNSLASLRQGLREKMLKSYLCDGPNFVRGLEENYRQLWYRYCDGDVPLEAEKNNEVTAGEVTIIPTKEASFAADPNTATTLTPTTPSTALTLSTTEGNKCQKVSPDSPHETRIPEASGPDE